MNIRKMIELEGRIQAKENNKKDEDFFSRFVKPNKLKHSKKVQKEEDEKKQALKDKLLEQEKIERLNEFVNYLNKDLNEVSGNIDDLIYLIENKFYLTEDDIYTRTRTQKLKKILLTLNGAIRSIKIRTK